MTTERFLTIDIPQGKLFGQLSLPESPRSLIIAPHAGDAHRAEAQVIAALRAECHAVLEIVLLTHQESGSELLHQIHVLVPRLFHLLDFAHEDGDTQGLPIGIFTTGSLAAVALRAAAERDLAVQALVVADGLIDRAGRQYLQILAAPLLVLLSEDQAELRVATERAFVHLEVPHALHVVKEISFADATCDWFRRQLPQARAASS